MAGGGGGIQSTDGVVMRFDGVEASASWWSTGSDDCTGCAAAVRSMKNVAGEGFDWPVESTMVNPVKPGGAVLRVTE